jgi:hypothetical protein
MDHNSVPVVVGAQFFRAQGGTGRLTPIAAAVARVGDVVVLPDHRTGTYLGAGRLRLDGGEWAAFVGGLPSYPGTQDLSAISIDPFRVQ